MQIICRLPWSSEPLGPKAPEKDALDKLRSTPMGEIPVLNKLKRKRTNSSDLLSPQRAQEIKKARPDDQLELSANSRSPAKSEIEQTFTQTPETKSGASIVERPVAVESVQGGHTAAQSLSTSLSTTMAIQPERISTTMDKAHNSPMQHAQP